MHSEGHSRSIHRDLVVSHLVGPARVLLPTAAVFVTYPVLLHRSGLEVVGVWSLLSTVVAYTSLLDIGFTSAITRALADESRGFSPMRLAAWRRAAARIYVGGGLAVAALAGGVSTLVLVNLGGSEGVGKREVSLGLVLLMLGTVWQLLAKLELTSFRAHHQTYVEQWAFSLTTTATYLIGLVGAYLGHPIGFLAGGSFAASGILYLVVRRRARRAFPVLYDELQVSARPLRRSDVEDLVSNGKHFFSLSVVFVLREPVFRLLIGWVLGVSSVGVYDIANRIPMLIRELGASGSQALFAGLARLKGGRNGNEAVHLLRRSFFFLFSIAGTGLALFAVSRELILRLWLGTQGTSASLSHAALILTIWWAVTLFNVPFFWLLQARGYERVLAGAVLLHTVLLFAVVLVGGEWLNSLTALLITWILTGLATQVIIYGVAEARTGLTGMVFLDRRVILYVMFTTALTGVTVWVSGHVSLPGLGQVAPIAAWCMLYVLVCGRFLWALRPATFGVSI